MKVRYIKLINALGFNIIWFGCIFYGNVFAVVATIILLAHLFYLRWPVSEIRLIFLVAFIGAAIDSALLQSNVFIFADSSHIIPVWLLVIWLGFAATLNHSLSFLKNRIWLQRLVGAIFAPLSYYAGYNLGAVNFGFSIVATLIILSITWFFLLPLCFYLADYQKWRVANV